jgi:hypothetical protein
VTVVVMMGIIILVDGAELLGHVLLSDAVVAAVNHVSRDDGFSLVDY